jgi:hypothetical protein
MSPSESPSPSLGYQDYTKEANVALPGNDDDLSTQYSAPEVAKVAVIDLDRVPQSANVDSYAIHQFKDFIGGALNNGTLTCVVQTNCPPSSSTVYLQIYNRVSVGWDPVDSDNSSNPDEDFTLTGFIEDFSNYKDGNTVISCRVYQKAAVIV